MTYKLLIAGINWPPETFIARLIEGLLTAGIEITVSCPQRPEAQWFSYPNFDWLPQPIWQNSFLMCLRLLYRTTKAIVFHPHKFLPERAYPTENP